MPVTNGDLAPIFAQIRELIEDSKRTYDRLCQVQTRLRSLREMGPKEALPGYVSIVLPVEQWRTLLAEIKLKGDRSPHFWAAVQEAERQLVERLLP